MVEMIYAGISVVPQVARRQLAAFHQLCHLAILQDLSPTRPVVKQYIGVYLVRIIRGTRASRIVAPGSTAVFKGEGRTHTVYNHSSRPVYSQVLLR